MNKQPLVSVVVVTYNSEKFILETLESIKKQTYKNIELIVSDDCSKDNTIKICGEWINKNKNYFASYKIITSEENTGIGSNCNRGLFNAKGEWIKLIAGDDALLDTCIEDYITVVNQNPSYYFFHSLCVKYQESFKESNLLPISKVFPNEIFRGNELFSQKQQFYNLLSSSSMEACTSFYHARIFKDLGGFEEKIKRSEDWPTWIKIAQKGYKFYFLNKPTVKYRINSNSVFSGSATQTIFPLFYNTEKEIYKFYIKEKAPFIIRSYFKYKFFYKDTLAKLNMTKKTTINQLIYKIFHKIEREWYQCIQNRIRNIQ